LVEELKKAEKAALFSADPLGEVPKVEQRFKEAHEAWRTRQTVFADQIKRAELGRDEAVKRVEQYKSVEQFMTEAADNGHLEFRVFVTIEKRVVELYRSKGFVHNR